jgi:hypothetical protein
MDYKIFIKALEDCQAERIKPLSLPHIGTSSRIPEIFCSVFPSIIYALNNCSEKICPDQGKIMGLFSLQIPDFSLCSHQPRQLKRIIDPKNIDRHFCAFLLGIPIKECDLKKANIIISWAAVKYLFIDFTTGSIADAGHYLTQTNCAKNPMRTIYGNIDAKLLAKTWDKFNVANFEMPYGFKDYQL